MARPTFFGDGHTPRRSDPQRIIICKKLGEIQDAIEASGGTIFAANDPQINDTVRILLQKILNALNGTAYTG